MTEGFKMWQRPKLSFYEMNLIIGALAHASNQNPEPLPGEQPWETEKRLELAESREVLMKRFLNMITIPERRVPEWEVNQ